MNLLPFSLLLLLCIALTSENFCEASALHPDLPPDCECQPIHDWSISQIPQKKLFQVHNVEDFRKAPADTEGIEFWTSDKNAVLESKHLEPLKHLSNLKLLKIDGFVSVRSGATRPLCKIETLEHLSLPTRCKNLNLLLEPVSALKNLRSIELGDVTDEALAHLRPCTKLEGLMLWQASKVTDKGLENLAAMRHLKYVTIAGTRITGNGIRFISQNADLRTLELGSNSELGNELAQYIGNFKNLCYLDLMDTQVGDPTMVEIAKVPSLLVLGLGRTKVGDNGARSLPALEQLVELRLFGTNVSDVGISSVSQCRRLESLNLGETNLTEKSWESIETLTRLKFLEVPKSIFTEQALSHMAKLRSLVDFQSGNSGLTDRNIDLETHLENTLPGLSINMLGMSCVRWSKAHFERRDKRLREAGVLNEIEPAGR